MNYANIKYYDIANGDGLRTSLFVSGCKNHCKGCFNPCAWDFLYGSKYTDEVQNMILDSIEPDRIRGLSILGGDPMEIENQPDVLNLILEFRKRFKDKKDIWLWTGYLIDQDLREGCRRFLPNVTNNILSNIDVIIDGPFIESQKNFTLKYRGSENQRVIYLGKDDARYIGD